MSKQIALDGPAGAGKSTVAKDVAKKLNLIYVDTGAMYRGIAIYLLDNDVDIEDENALDKALKNVKISIDYIDGMQHVFVNGKDVTSRLRVESTGNMASKSSAKPLVRKKLLDLQRQLASENDVIMDGRDIGTVILPNATLKVFLTASVDVRAKRRYDQLLLQGESNPNLEKIAKEIKERDDRDMNRKEAPLKQAKDAILVDNSNMTQEETCEAICKLFRGLL